MNLPPTLLPDCHLHQTTWQKNLPVIGAVDRWLTANLESAYPSCYLLMGDGPANEVLCTVQRFHIKASNTGHPDLFILYITGSVLPQLGIPILSCSSPRATLARYIGFQNDLEAPSWTKWDRSILSFYQPRCLFADMFARMAAWEENRAVKGLSYRMIEWAKTISVRTWLDSNVLAETPQNAQKYFVVINTPRFNKRDSDALASPCQRKRARLDGAGTELDLSDGGSEDELDRSFYPRLLSFTKQ